MCYQKRIKTIYHQNKDKTIIQIRIKNQWMMRWKLAFGWVMKRDSKIFLIIKMKKKKKTKSTKLLFLSFCFWKLRIIKSDLLIYIVRSLCVAKKGYSAFPKAPELLLGVLVV